MRWLIHPNFLSRHIAETTSLSMLTTSSRLRRKILRNRSLYYGNSRWRVSSRIATNLQCSPHSTKATELTQQNRKIEVVEYLASDQNSYGQKNNDDGVLRTLRSSDTKTNQTWDIVQNTRETETDTYSRLKNRFQVIPKKVMSLLLPAQYPQSVAKGYFGFASFCFTASIAGSAAMVLSTQTLLFAVGIVGASSSSAGVMAGALNWVMKDFMGQLGGIVFASQMGKTKAFDNDPKRWRMVAAIALDGATMLEILSPLCHHSLVLPVASIANIGKNIGFLTASASRAALHQSLATTGNLGDVTVKAGSQSMMASLLGTSLGIGLSTLLQHDTFNFGICFLGLSAIHQGCTYLSLQNVALARFNRQRLHLALDYYLIHRKVPTPADVAKMERFFPFVSSSLASSEWLRIGRPLRDVCRNPTELEKCLALAPNEAYLIRLDESTRNVDLIFFDHATEQDICRGIYHACFIRFESSSRESCTRDLALENITRQASGKVQNDFPHLFCQLREQGWDTSSGVTDAEDKNAHRIKLKVV